MSAPLPRTWFDTDRREQDPRAKVIRQLVTAGNLLLTAAIESRAQINNAADAWALAIVKLRALDAVACHECGRPITPVSADDRDYPVPTPQGLVHQGCMADHRAHYD